MHNGWSKWILRNSVKELVPSKVVWRRDKKGFPTPERKWMMKIKEDFLLSVNENRDELSEYLNIDEIIKNYDSIVSDPDIKSHFIWKIYNFSKWKKMFGVSS